MGAKRPLCFAMGVVSVLGLMGTPPASTQSVVVSDDNITIAGNDVLTLGDATPVYIRGTGYNDEAHRIVKLGNTILVDDTNRGLTLTILDALTHTHVSSNNYDTWEYDADSDALASSLAAMTEGQVGILTSYDAFEAHLTSSLRAEARRLGLFNLAGKARSADLPSRRHPYAAIFYGSGGANHKAVEVLQPNAATAPHAIIATWLIGDGFVGQSVTPADYLRCSGVPGLPGPRYTDCGDGTVVDNHTGLFWLKDGSCDALGTSGAANWETAMSAAVGLADGMCGLSDGSVAGDWRLPTASELCSGWAPSSSICPVSAKSNSLMNTRFQDPSISNAEGDAQWSEGDAFVGLPGSCWSGTEIGIGNVWAADFYYGELFSATKTAVYHIWPVRGAL